jgi:hypothetical protein
VNRLAAAQSLLEPGEVRVDDGGVALDGEQQRDVDVDAVGDRPVGGLDPGRGGGDLDHRVGAVDALPQVAGGGERGVGVVRERRVDLEAHEAVGALGPVVDRRQHVGGGADVLDRQRLVDLTRRAAGESADPLGIPGTAEHGGAEDRRVRRQAGHTRGVREAL